MTVWIVISVITFPIAMLLFILAYLIGKKKEVHLIHDYHYNNVAKEQLDPYASRIGTAITYMGIGIVSSNIACIILQSALGYLAFSLFFTIGVIIFVKAQFKYKKSIF